MTPGLIGKTAGVNRGKIRDSWTICDLIGQEHDTLSDWQDHEAQIQTKTNHKALCVIENLTNNHIKDASKISWQLNQPFHLFTEPVADQTDHHSKPFRSVIHNLSLESFLFTTTGPKYPLPYIHYSE